MPTDTVRVKTPPEYRQAVLVSMTQKSVRFHAYPAVDPNDTSYERRKKRESVLRRNRLLLQEALYEMMRPETRFGQVLRRLDAPSIADIDARLRKPCDDVSEDSLDAESEEEESAFSHMQDEDYLCNVATALPDVVVPDETDEDCNATLPWKVHAKKNGQHIRNGLVHLNGGRYTTSPGVLTFVIGNPVCNARRRT